MTIYHQFLIHQSTMPDCAKARGLIDWLWWSQTSTTALSLAQKNYLGVPGQSTPVRKRLLDIVAGMTCDGAPVSSIHDCIYQSTVCSDHGVCNQDGEGDGVCYCDPGYEGDHCEIVTSNGSGADLAPILGAIIPAAVIGLAIVCCVMVAMFVWARRTRHKEDDWEVDMGEIEMGEQLGAGGFGEVHKAVWKGTEVAVKMMISENAGRELERNFKEEVRVMTALRHPNVVLFMAACTKPPKMCIVMEYMALGSLFDVRFTLLALILL
jgi:hypothetical protein